MTLPRSYRTEYRLQVRMNAHPTDVGSAFMPTGSKLPAQNTLQHAINPFVI